MATAGRRAKADYSGRTVDLLLLKTVLDAPAYGVRVGIDVSDVEGRPMIVSGIEKMVQRFALLFLNAMGSTMFRPGHGTGLIPEVSRGRVYDMPSLEAAAAEANMMARTSMMSADDGLDTPDDELIASSEVTGLEFSRERSGVSISIKLTTQAGESFAFIVPVAVGVH